MICANSDTCKLRYGRIHPCFVLNSATYFVTITISTSKFKRARAYNEYFIIGLTIIRCHRANGGRPHPSCWIGVMCHAISCSCHPGGSRTDPNRAFQNWPATEHASKHHAMGCCSTSLALSHWVSPPRLGIDLDARLSQAVLGSLRRGDSLYGILDGPFRAAAPTVVLTQAGRPALALISHA